MLIPGLILFALCAIAFAIIAIRAPFGFEDDTGFHCGEQPFDDILRGR